MAGIATVRIVGAEALSKKIKKLGKKVKNPAPLHKLWGASIFRWVIRNFEGQGNLALPGGWKSLSPVTIAGRRRGNRRGGSPRILQDTGTLRKSFTFTSDIRNATIGNIKAGTATGYALDHQFGVPKRNLPARPMLPPKFKLIEKTIETITINYLEAKR